MNPMTSGRLKCLCPCLFLMGLFETLPIAAEAAEAEFTIEARDFDGSNARVSLTGQPYADGPSCIWNGGELPNWAEYEIEFPVTADYTLSALYAAAQARPVEISLDGKKICTGFKGVTGDWNTKSAKWEQQGTLPITCGTHTVRLQCDGPFPHICGLRLQSSVPFPEGWKLPRPSPEQRAERVRLSAHRAQLRAKIAALESIDLEAVRLAIEDMEQEFPGRYDGMPHRQTLAQFDRGRAVLLKSLADGKQEETESVEKLLAGIRAALLANPLLDADKLLVVRRRFGGAGARHVTGADAGFVPANYLNQTAMSRGNWDNEIAIVSGLRSQPRIDRLYKPSGGQILRDMRLDFPADRMSFSSIDANGRWAIYEIRSDGSSLKQLTPTDYPDLDFFDACYLPDGRIVLCSTGNYFGLPCLDGNGQIASLYLLDPATKALRQLTFDQDSDNDPTVLNDGRVLFQRWEYSDIPHYFSRRRFGMNPDGTGQVALYGSNSWFPTAFRFAKPVPDHPTRLVGIISGHHDFGDCGRMAILDPGLAGTYPFRYRPTSKEWGVEGEPIAVTPDVLPAEQTGFLQLIPGRGKTVAGTVCDAIIGHLYRKERPALTTHPYPLSSKYFLVSMKPTPQSLWGIYLVDVFDNATLVVEIEEAALFEPQLLLARPRPPVIPDRVKPGCRTAEVHIADIYSGPGLPGVPRGTVKSLRVFSYHFGYNAKAGFPLVGTQAGWDMKRVLGTASVEPDGSAYFQIPANTPISIQPLDGEGRAVQLMRSWFVGMPGEQISCVGCHEDRRATLPTKRSLAHRRRPQPLEPWYGSPRPFAFAHEVFPVLEQYCIGCHDKPPTVGPRSNPCFKDPDTAYNTLHPYVHRPGVESDMALLTPMEYHASTSVLIQMLEKGHHGVKLTGMSREARERLTCWIDLNVPRAGNWNPPRFQNFDQRQRRCELAKTLANNDDDPEAEYQAAAEAFKQRTPIPFNAPPPENPVPSDGLKATGFPLTVAEASRLQQAHSAGAQQVIDLAAGVKLTLAWIPPGEFVMGRLEGAPDERPRCVVRVSQPFWMAVTEVTNGQYALFDPQHDTRYIDMHSLDRVVPGYIANHPDQPVARVSWSEAVRFCEWMSRKTGLKVTLPTEAQWEWAARAGSESQFFYGTLETDFGRFANLADQALRWYSMGYDGPSALQRRHPYPPEMNFPLHDERFRDMWFVVDYVGQTEANAWGLKDMVGNVSEWTRSSYRPYPYRDDDGRNDGASPERKVARGGSWADRPADAGSAVRRVYQPWQSVYDVGFRVIVEAATTGGQVTLRTEKATPR
ncbi:MAG: SUMF1/EgtB/PvdO family nonheme iron enzyme [Planctomycetota bacterium]|nr:SUMF1/EgtB/PvdO family nonheme iron enzyme [Planctomycetota bacterium]